MFCSMKKRPSLAVKGPSSIYNYDEKPVCRVRGKKNTLWQTLQDVFKTFALLWLFCSKCHEL